MKVVGYSLNRLGEPVFIAVSKPLLTEFGIHHRLESCETYGKWSTDDDLTTFFFQ